MGRGGARTRGGGGRPSAAAAAPANARHSTASNTRNTSMSKGMKSFFKVELLVGARGQRRVRMAPFEEVVDETVSTDSYVAVEGQPFAIRVTIARPRRDNSVYGGRVYIDAPCNAVEQLNENDGMDHFFWIGPGQTEYIIEGFYKNHAESQQFVFAKPAQQNECATNTWRSIGGIRIAFSLLERWEQRGKNQTFEPKQAAIDAEASIERKGKELSAQPGDTVTDNLPQTEREAVLSDEVVFEKRIEYDTICGYMASQEMRKYFNRKTLYKRLPIVILMQEDVQRKCIDMYLTLVPSKLRDAKIIENLDNTAGQSSSEVAAPAKPDKWLFVRVTDIVNEICKDLSPAGSYLICTGQCHVDKNGNQNYGETVLQNSEATSEATSEEERRADYETKVQGLTKFFNSNPHVYDSQDCGADEETGRIRFEVRKAVVDLTANSDDEFG